MGVMVLKNKMYTEFLIPSDEAIVEILRLSPIKIPTDTIISESFEKVLIKFELIFGFGDCTNE